MRKIICCNFIVLQTENELSILAVKRGSGAKTKPNKWCVPGGHLEDTETLTECAKRELYEETGINIDEKEFSLFDIEDGISIHPDFIIFDYYVKVNKKYNIDFSNCEQDEIIEAKWIPFNKIDKYDWAFELQYYTIKKLL